MFHGFEEVGVGPTALCRTVGDYDVHVRIFGGSWGYTVWNRSALEGGARDWNWTAMDACREALDYLRRKLKVELPDPAVI